MGGYVRLGAPALILWGATGGVGRNHNPGPGDIWKAYATDIRGARTVPSGQVAYDDSRLADHSPATTVREGEPPDSAHIA